MLNNAKYTTAQKVRQARELVDPDEGIETFLK
jgi:hypothetical protein